MKRLPAPATLEDLEAFCAYVWAVSPDEPDREMLQEMFRGAAAHMCRIPIRDLEMGEAASHLEVPGRARVYAALPSITRPPILVECGRVIDGHHRLRDAISRGETEILAYELVDADEIDALRTQAQAVELRWWLGGTTVVDRARNPLPVFHGTSAQFEEFEPNPRGLFFALDPAVATGFSTIRGGHPRVLQAFLRIERPWTIIRYGDTVPYSQQLDQTPGALAAQGYDGIWCPDDQVWIAFWPEQVRIAVPDVHRHRESARPMLRKREREIG